METGKVQNTEEVCTLHYFGVNCRGAIPRAILAYKNIPFKEVNIEFSQWPAEKTSGKYEFGQLPLLEYKGLQMSQSIAIDLHLAREFNLLGNNSTEEYYIISLRASYDDWYPRFRVAVLPFSEEETKNLKLKETEFLETHAPSFLDIYEKRFKNVGGKYAVGDSFSLADIFLTVHLMHVFRAPSRKETWEPVLVKHAPNLAKHIIRISENELSGYFSKGYVSGAPV